MNSDSSGPSRAGDEPDPSSLAYCRRLPYRSCKALTAVVNTNDPKLWGIGFRLGFGSAQRRPEAYPASMPLGLPLQEEDSI